MENFTLHESPAPKKIKNAVKKNSETYKSDT